MDIFLEKYHTLGKHVDPNTFNIGITNPERCL